ncbi:hypothetical protein hbim_05340 [Mycolicibacterium mageritense]|uniref:Uncharacterized protein n=1 Tax=Mycolicibacterium mageritense TaxID=53462 RepID=A0AAI8TYZ6_MYCME|nr:hypothetical protein hbim_05340 [Mycolicibacterium mageritense]
MGTSRPDQPDGRRRPGQELKHAHDLLAEWGVSLSSGKVRGLVREYLHKVQPRGIQFEDYLRNAVVDAGETHIRRVAGRVLNVEAKGRVIAHNDQPTGETATWNVFTERDLRSA